MRKSDGLENYLKKKKKIFPSHLSHSRECGSRAPFPVGSRMILEGSHVWNKNPGELIDL